MRVEHRAEMLANFIFMDGGLNRDQIAQLTKVVAKLVDSQIPDEDEPDEPGE